MQRHKKEKELTQIIINDCELSSYYQFGDWKSKLKSYQVLSSPKQLKNK